MVVTDTIADMICRINNALMRKKSELDIPLSKVKQEIARLLKEEGYIANYEVIEDKVQGTLRVSLKYTPEGDSVIRELKRRSRPGKRQYVGIEEIPKVIEGLGRAVISTSRGLMTDKECRKNRLGGEVLLYVW
ncbi:MAG: 30S ribosomal protein S8 [Elusimicrobia bacterium]|jgi:small subunit ribosomal protein S8|nr:30S ribosomal protein S8 [Elusimicrobiota bacterium]